jgi:hypothetical protein
MVFKQVENICVFYSEILIPTFLMVFTSVQFPSMLLEYINIYVPN